MKNQSECLSKWCTEYTRGPGIPEAKNSNRGTSGKAYHKEWSGQYCCVPLCWSSSGEGEERERVTWNAKIFFS